MKWKQTPVFYSYIWIWKQICALPFHSEGRDQKILVPGCAQLNDLGTGVKLIYKFSQIQPGQYNPSVKTFIHEISIHVHLISDWDLKIPQNPQNLNLKDVTVSLWRMVTTECSPFRRGVAAVCCVCGIILVDLISGKIKRKLNIHQGALFFCFSFFKSSWVVSIDLCFTGKNHKTLQIIYFS